MVLYAQNEQPNGFNAFFGCVLTGMERDTFKDKFNGASESLSFASSILKLTGTGRFTTSSIGE